MSQALFTVIGGALINLSNVNFVENSTGAPGHVIVHFQNNEKVALDGSVEVVLAKLGGGGEERPSRRAPAPGNPFQGEG